jgi:cation-transporting ATPase 13A1
VTSAAGGSSAGDASGVAVPCDAVILRGGAVVNEASLTGESIPQIKEALHVTPADAARALDINTEHRMHVLFSGTTVMQISGSASSDADDESGVDERDVLPLRAPDGGAVCCCLRTGFGSSQGTLVRMIEFSSDAVMGSTTEAIALLLILLAFALMASAYVLVTGLAAGKRTQVERRACCNARCSHLCVRPR